MITREDKIHYSVLKYIRDSLVARGYGPEVVKVREAFPVPEERSQPLALTTVAIGFSFDDGGIPMELGSNLKRFMHTIEFWAFGTTPELGLNVAQVVRAFLLDDYLVPLLDIGEAGQPVIDQLELEDEGGVVVQRQIAGEPLQWDRYVWTTTARFIDYYNPSAVD